MVRIAWFVVLVGLLFSAGCASIVSETGSTTYFQTKPENARCELHGQDFVRVVNTPDSITLPSEASPITVACTAEGYRNTVEMVEGKYDGWIWGNILFGGVVGAVIDGSRGAGKKFPPQVLVVLEPESFADVAERDAFFDYKKSLITEQWSEPVARTEKKCDRNKVPRSTFCNKLDSIIEERDAKLAELENERLQATIAPPQPEPVQPESIQSEMESQAESPREAAQVEP